MAKDTSEVVRDALGQLVRDAAQSIGNVNGGKRSSPLSGGRGVAAGAGLAAVAPLAAKGVKSLAQNTGARQAVTGAGSKLTKGAGKKVQDTVGKKIDDAGGVGGIAKDVGKTVLPGSGGGGGKDGAPGVGKGRRMPVQQSVDVAVPIETVYNQWTQFEDWPSFMHRLENVSQEDECTVSFKTKMWGISKEFTAQIVTQRPEERIKWRVTEGVTHTGVVTFHELADRLTRIEVNVDIDPGSLIEKAARGMRHVKRAIRADLARFKAFIEIQELETGAWRGVIENGELVEPHPDDYDQERDYSEFDDIYSDEEPGGARDDEAKDSQRARGQRFKQQAERSTKSRRSSSGSSRSSSGSKGSSSSRSRSRGAGTGSGRSSRGRSSGSGSSRSSGRSGSSGGSSSGRRTASSAKRKSSSRS